MTTSITITEALAEIPTIIKRIEKKQQFINSYLHRVSVVRDPHEKDGGSAALIEREFQSIKDLQERIIAIRGAIQRANQENTITVCEQTRTINDWLVWRRELAEQTKSFYANLNRNIQAIRTEAIRKGVSVSDQDKGYSGDFIVNVNEKKLAETIENMEEILGKLDGQLSLSNARIYIDIP